MSRPFFCCAWWHYGSNGLSQCVKRAGHWWRHLDRRGERWLGGF